MKKIIFSVPFLLLASLFCPVNLKAQTIMAFGDGEKLTYSISYKAAVVNTDVGGVTIETKRENYNGQDVYRIRAVAVTYPFYKTFYDLVDTYVVRLNTQTLKPIDLQAELIEGSFRASMYYCYDWGAMQSINQFRNLTKNTSEQYTVPLQSNSMDAISLFFNLRNRNITSFQAGYSESLSLLLNNKVRNVRFTFVGREDKNIRGLGRYKTLRFTCELRGSDDNTFEAGAQFTVWVSDDGNKIPLYIESPITVGSIRGRLLDAQNLLHPLTSRIN